MGKGQNIKKIAIALIIAFIGLESKSQSDFFAIDTIQKIEIFFSESDWDFILDSERVGNDDYIQADYVVINSDTIFNVGVKYKGNSSYDSTYKKNPIHIELNHYNLSQTYKGLEDIKLSNCYADPSMIREVLAYDILKQYMHCSRANFAKLFINNQFIGLYTNTQNVNKKLCREGFFSSNNTFVKCNPTINPSPSTKSNLKYIGSDSSAYTKYYTIKSDLGLNDIMQLCEIVTNSPERISEVFDIDKVLWMLAFNNVCVNLDSYSGAFAQNYYIYKDETGHYNPIVWDLNMSFGGFSHLGSGATSMNTLSVDAMKSLSPFIHETDPNWPLIKAVMSNDLYKKIYLAHIKTILQEQFISESYITKANELYNIIESTVLSDTNKFYSNNDFYNSLDSSALNGTFTIPGIKNLIDARINNLLANEFIKATAPTISNNTLSNNNPSIGENISFKAKCDDCDKIFLAYRKNINEKFIQVEMFDNGENGDSIPNDNYFATNIEMQTPLLHYYFLAKNDSAASILPAKAEHDFFEVKASTPNIEKNSLSINEFMASNDEYEFNEYFGHTDWIELYNNTDEKLYLGSCYISDSYANPLKFRIPESTFIEPHGYLIIWADKEPSSNVYVHSNFSLDAEGEKLILSNAQGIVLDSLEFGIQTSDVSTGRCPDGIGDFSTSNLPSFLRTNCISSDIETNTTNLNVFPNPCNNEINIINEDFNSYQIEIENALGEIFIKQNSENEVCTINTQSLKAGLYIVIIKKENTIVAKAKFLKI